MQAKQSSIVDFGKKSLRNLAEASPPGKSAMETAMNKKKRFFKALGETVGGAGSGEQQDKQKAKTEDKKEAASKAAHGEEEKAKPAISMMKSFSKEWLGSTAAAAGEKRLATAPPQAKGQTGNHDKSNIKSKESTADAKKSSISPPLPPPPPLQENNKAGAKGRTPPPLPPRAPSITTSTAAAAVTNKPPSAATPSSRPVATVAPSQCHPSGPTTTKATPTTTTTTTSSGQAKQLSAASVTAQPPPPPPRTPPSAKSGPPKPQSECLSNTASIAPTTSDLPTSPRPTPAASASSNNSQHHLHQQQLAHPPPYAIPVSPRVKELSQSSSQDSSGTLRQQSTDSTSSLKTSSDLPMDAAVSGGKRSGSLGGFHSPAIEASRHAEPPLVRSNSTLSNASIASHTTQSFFSSIGEDLNLLASQTSSYFGEWFGE